jgi:transposase-like protein/IS1 family transposase
MFCSHCQSEARKFGRNRNGSQRYRCDACRRTWTDESTRPADRRRLSQDKTIACLRMLLEGNSVRSVERLTGVHRDTIIDMMVEAGKACKRFLEATIRRVPVADVQADEVWGFVGCKERTKQYHGYGEEVGDAYCFTAFERTTKLIVAWHLGKRSPGDTEEFTEKLSRATTGRFQLTTDGFTPYRVAVRESFGPRVDYATLVKEYATPDDGQRRYSPADIVGITITIRMGEPDKDRVCTSHVARRTAQPEHPHGGSPDDPADGRPQQEMGEPRRGAGPLLRVLQLRPRPFHDQNNARRRGGSDRPRLGDG